MSFLSLKLSGIPNMKHSFYLITIIDEFSIKKYTYQSKYKRCITPEKLIPLSFLHKLFIPQSIPTEKLKINFINPIPMKNPICFMPNFRIPRPLPIANCFIPSEKSLPFKLPSDDKVKIQRHREFLKKIDKEVEIKIYLLKTI